MNAETATGRLATAARSATLLGAFALLGAGLVAVTYDLSRERIADNQQQVVLQRLNEIVPPDAYSNEIQEDTIKVSAPELSGSDPQVTVYRARKDGKPVAVIMEVTAPDGYSGAIHLLVGVKNDGELAGVRVVAHRETPGLGDDIEVARSDWILQFAGKSLQEPPPEQWAVRRDGGTFDQFTGATITPRAVVKAVRNALIYFRNNRDLLFSTETTSS